MRELIEDGRVHLFDGAMGTLLYARGVPIDHPFELLHEQRPALVLDIHTSYIEAGGELSPYVRRNAELTALNLLFVAKLLRDNPYPINIAEHNKLMMERNKVKGEAMKQAVQYMRQNMPT